MVAVSDFGVVMVGFVGSWSAGRVRQAFCGFEARLVLGLGGGWRWKDVYKSPVQASVGINPLSISFSHLIF
jgi:hypothetical protein